MRLEGKLPHDERPTAVFGLEYGFDALAAHRDFLEGGKSVLLVDDLLATGMTLAACADLVREAGGDVCGAAVVVEVTAFEGRDKLSDLDLLALCQL